LAANFFHSAFCDPRSVLKMDTPTTTKIAKKHLLFLPYWAVFQTDLRQIMRNWVYRVWVLASLLAASGYLLYRMGVHREAGLIQHASVVMSDLLRWMVLGSVALITAISVGSIAAERGTLADSVLSRGISRYQYFLAKWHARLFAVIGTFFVTGVLLELGSYFVLHENLSLRGSIMALAVISMLFTVVVTAGVTLSAYIHSPIVGMSVLWLVLYGAGVLMELLPKKYPTPDRILCQLPTILIGDFETSAMNELFLVTMVLSVVVGAVGLIGFGRRDV